MEKAKSSHVLQSERCSVSPASKIGSCDEREADHVIWLGRLRASICRTRARQELFSRLPLLRGAFLKIPCKLISPLLTEFKRTLKATIPTMMPRAKKTNATINQITPQTVVWIRIHSFSDVKRYSPRDGQQPQISANALASELLTLRRMVSS